MVGEAERRKGRVRPSGKNEVGQAATGGLPDLRKPVPGAIGFHRWAYALCAPGGREGRAPGGLKDIARDAGASVSGVRRAPEPKRLPVAISFDGFGGGANGWRERLSSAPDIGRRGLSVVQGRVIARVNKKEPDAAGASACAASGSSSRQKDWDAIAEQCALRRATAGRSLVHAHGCP